ncbi:MAG: DUF4179 domain-containing protein, partial [Clostridium sp.]
MSKDIFTNKSDLENDDLQIKSFLKENNNLKVPIEISIGIDAVLRDLNSDISKETPKKTNGILSKVAMVALIALSLTIATSIVNPTLVKAMPVVGKIFDFFSGESANKFNDASILIGMSAKDKGITVTLEEASMDSEKFMATLKVTGKSFNTNKIDVEVGGSANNRRFSPSSSTIKRIDDTTVVV